MPRAEPFSVWASVAIPSGSRAHAGDQQCRLAVEQLQHLALEAAVAERHAGEMNEIDRPVVRRERGRGLDMRSANIVICRSRSARRGRCWSNWRPRGQKGRPGLLPGRQASMEMVNAG